MTPDEALEALKRAAVEWGNAMSHWRHLNEEAIAGRVNTYHCIAAGMDAGKLRGSLDDAAEAYARAVKP